MHSFSILAIFVAGTAVALPASTMRLQARKKCDLVACATALGGPAFTCIAAALQEGLDPLVDLPCVIGVANTVENPPEACGGCNDAAAAPTDGSSNAGNVASSSDATSASGNGADTTGDSSDATSSSGDDTGRDNANTATSNDDSAQDNLASTASSTDGSTGSSSDTSSAPAPTATGDDTQSAGDDAIVRKI